MDAGLAAGAFAACTGLLAGLWDWGLWNGLPTGFGVAIGAVLGAALGFGVAAGAAFGAVFGAAWGLCADFGAGLAAGVACGPGAAFGAAAGLAFGLPAPALSATGCFGDCLSFLVVMRHLAPSNSAPARPVKRAPIFGSQPCQSISSL